MKKFLLASAALVAVASPAMAQTDQVDYAGRIPVIGPLHIPYTISGNSINGVGEAGVLAGIGTRYTAQADAPSNTTALTPTVTVNFALTGEVQKDCSFYAGNSVTNNTTNIDFGVIGVRTGNNENVSDAFEMVGDAEAEIETLTAGCNFNNRVTVAKNNALGLVNSTVSGFDNTQFQNNIPYTVQARWRGTTNQTMGAVPGNQSVSLSTTQQTAFLNQGAWRSAMEIDIVAPVASLGLVAGDYTGTMTLTLAAL